MADKEYINRTEWIQDLQAVLLLMDITSVLKRDKFDETRQGAEILIEILKDRHTADVVEVRHERFEWGYQNGQYGIWCTNCGAGWVDSENAEWIAHEHDYCPKCGAKMDGKGEGE